LRLQVPAMQPIVGARHEGHTRPPCGRQLENKLCNQKGADSGSFLFGRMAAYMKRSRARLAPTLLMSGDGILGLDGLGLVRLDRRRQRLRHTREGQLQHLVDS
jgi:hypothetical protein